MSKCKIGLIGFGTVGKGVYKILNSSKNPHPILKDIKIEKIVVKNLTKNRDLPIDKELLTNDFNLLIDDPSIDVIVEVMGGTTLAKEIILKSFIVFCFSFFKTINTTFIAIIKCNNIDAL